MFFKQGNEMNQQAMQDAAQAAIDATIHEYAFAGLVICLAYRIIEFLFDR